MLSDSRLRCNNYLAGWALTPRKELVLHRMMAAQAAQSAIDGVKPASVAQAEQGWNRPPALRWRIAFHARFTMMITPVRRRYR